MDLNTENLLALGSIVTLKCGIKKIMIDGYFPFGRNRP